MEPPSPCPSKEHKATIRAHYAALVKGIDDKVGKIIDSLKATDKWNNTIVIFCSDHGDYLGDHGLIGKGAYYESSTKVPLIVRHPAMSESIVHESPATVMDITATLLHFGGCEVPGYMDSRPLADLGVDGSESRKQVYGFVTGGSMSYDGTWKLARYATGYGALFNVDDDPAEQNNRIDDPDCQEIRDRLDSELNAHMIRSINLANAEKNHQTSWEDPLYCAGESQWNRVYPQPIS